ncbi:hypothetical protein G4B88_000661 [Cannabis sativa]|uniref:DNA-directed RNA polymerase n=1 Tax=Cannabis sativa TaxID=3483 RepID=A0A7J6HIA1_CANSA|nr:hypothetical protein G4B88_000661 [Cannabis sativa]
MCNFDISLLPIKLNLPMVCKPLDWTSKKPRTLADIEGGYLSGVTGDFYNRFRLLSSHDYENFYILLKDPNLMCNVLNTLQSQVFERNNNVGILMDRRLAKVNLQGASDLLRSCYANNEGIKEVCRFKKLLSELVKRVQHARYEDFVLTLVSA